MSPQDNSFQSTPALSTVETEALPSLGQTAEEVRTPSFGQSMSAATYSAIHEGTTADVLTWAQTRVIGPEFTDVDRPYLKQDQVNQLWKDAGIPDAAPDARKYNDVGIYTLIDKAKHRQAARDVDEATQASVVGSTARGVASFALSMADPINAATGFFPAAGLARFAGLAGTAARIEGITALSTTAETLAGRVGARVASGAIEGAVGNIPLEAITAPMRNEMGEDYTAADSMRNLLLGTALGGGLHVAVGSLGKLPTRPSKAIADAEPKVDEFGFSVEQAPIAKMEAPKVDEEILQSAPMAADNLDVAINKSIDTPDTINIKNVSELLQNPNIERADIPAEDNILAGYLADKTTTPRMADEVLTKYNEQVKALEKSPDVTEINKATILQDAIDSVKPTTAELTEMVTPPTRELAAKIAIAQSLDERFPTVDAVLNSDPVINKATHQDVAMEMRQASDPKNSYVTMEAGKVTKPDMTLKYDDEIDLNVEIANREAKIAEMEKLQEAGVMYSKQTPEEINTKTNAVALEIPKETIVKPLSKEAIKSVGENPGVKTRELIDNLQKTFGKDADRLLETSKIKIVEDVKDLPGIHADDVKGMTVLQDGSVYLVAKNLSPNQVRGVVLHEIGVHSNMREFLGDAGYNKLLKQVDNLLEEDPRLRDILDNIMIKLNIPEMHRAEERLAYLVENASNSGIVREFLAKVKAWLYKTFPSLQEKMGLSQADVAAIALSSLRNYARKETPNRLQSDGVMYSKIEDIIDNTKEDIDTINTIIKKADTYSQSLKSIASELADIDDKNIFREMLDENIGRTSKEEADGLYNMFNRALRREQEKGSLNAPEAAIDYVMTELKADWLASKKSLVYDRAIKARASKFLDTMTDLPEDGIKALLMGTANQRAGTQVLNTSLEKSTILDRYMSEFDNKIIQGGLAKAFNSKAFDDDIMRGMYYLQTNDTEKFAKLAPEAQQIAKITEDLYSSMLTAMNETGLTVNKLKGYYFNQMAMHDQQKITILGQEKWVGLAKKTMDIERMAEEMNMASSDFDDDFWSRAYTRFASGEHANEGGGSKGMDATYNSFNAKEPFRKVSTKERKYHFKDVEAALEYYKACGNKSFAGAVGKTIDANAKKLAITKTLGVNYERNVHELISELSSKVVIPEQQKKFGAIKKEADLMIQGLDGRADIPVKAWLARCSANIRSVLSMDMLGKSALAGLISDPINAARQDVKLGMTKLPLPMQYIKRFGEQFNFYSAERKAVIRSMGVSTDNLLMDAYRYDSVENNISGMLARTQRRFFQAALIDKQGTSFKMSAMDMIGSAHAGFTKIKFSELSHGVQRYLQRHDINAQDWELISKTQLKQVDGKEYLIPEKIRELKNDALDVMKSKGLDGDLANIAAEKYLTNLEDKMTKYYRDLLARQYMEPNDTSKFYATLKGSSKKGDWAGEMVAFAMMFKQYGVNFWRNVILDEVYSQHDTFTDFAKDWNTKAGLKQKAGIVWQLAHFAIAGYFTMAVYDIFGGRKPRPLVDEDGYPRVDTLIAALQRSGGLGFMGDYLFADYNRNGQSLSGALAGPFAGRIGDFAALTQATVNKGYHSFAEGNSPDVGARWLRFAQGLLPSTFYSNIILNYALFYGLQEQFNPGYLNRMERRMEKLSGQEFLVAPSEYAVQF
jgi:hypothetical protein